MSGYPLKAVLEQRRREEEAAAQRLADAARQRLQAEALATRKQAVVTAAEENLRAARGDRDGVADSRAHTVAGVPRSPISSGAEAAAHARFAARLRDDLSRARAEQAAFEAGPLRDARDAETGARHDHLGARLAREALDRHAERFRQGARRAAERRDEDALEDVARAARHLRDARES